MGKKLSYPIFFQAICLELPPCLVFRRPVAPSVQVVQSIKEVTLESIATKLAMPIKFESRRKKVQRFLSDDEWDLDNIWLPLVVAWIVRIQVKNARGGKIW